MTKMERMFYIKRDHAKYWENWDKPFPPNQYANWKQYDVNDVQFLIEEVERLKKLLTKANIVILDTYK